MLISKISTHSPKHPFKGAYQLGTSELQQICAACWERSKACEHCYMLLRSNRQ